MAAFSTLALVGLAAGAGVFAGKKLAGSASRSDAAAPQTPAPTSAAQSLASPEPPPSAPAAQSQAQATARTTASRTRKRLASPVGASRPPAPRASGVRAMGSPASLIGASY